jgi:hypothetical protein
VVAAAIALATPLMWWSMFVSVDAAGSALLLAAVYGLLRGRERRALLLACAGIAAHLAVAPLVVAGIVVAGRARARARSLVVGAIVVAAITVAAVTPSGGNAAGFLQPGRVLIVGSATLAIVGLAFLPAAGRLLCWSRASWLLVAFAVGTFLAAGVVGAAERSSNARYGLPLVLLLCAAASVPRLTSSSQTVPA